MGRLRVLGATAAVLTLLVSGCGGDKPDVRMVDPQGSGAAADQGSKPDRKAYDPPVKFDAGGAVSAPVEEPYQSTMVNRTLSVASMLLDGTTLYAAGASQLEIIETETGEVTSTIRPDRDSPWKGSDGVAGRPVLATVGGERLLLVPFTVKMPGEGTAKATAGIELVAVSTKTGKRAWDMMIDLPAVEAEDLKDTYSFIVGVEGSLLVLRASAVGTHVVDLEKRKEVWHNEDFPAGAVAAGVVVGTLTPDPSEVADVQITGLALADGTKRWALDEVSYSVRIFPAGANRVVTNSVKDRTLSTRTRVFDAATGTVVFGDWVEYVQCRYDGISTTVCMEREWIGAFDQTSKGWLWEISEERDKREIPEVTTVWHGAVYGTTKTNGPVVLDAKTGADRETDPGLAPFAVNEYVGIGASPGGSIMSYPAAG
ncbi:MAG: hypothetical protein HKP61_19500 [Dactylosporangium sp.]|nr:PQQ-like beta-propeller repeat protein [Dactylosporangium sp.]NNJ63076.1 hypothetical protein [Dactylosporangium sp.]